MGITKQIFLALIAVPIVVGVIFFLVGRHTKPTDQNVAHSQNLTSQADFQAPVFYPYLVAVKYTYEYEPGYPQNRPPVDIVAWLVESQKQPSRAALEREFRSLTPVGPTAAKKLTGVEVLAISRIENRAWWPGKYIRIDSLQPEDPNEPPTQ
jgi:hypothetical protein